MTASGPPGDDAHESRWLYGAASALADASERAGRLANAIADDWRDGHGQEWAERTALLHRELGRVAAEAAEMGAAITRRAMETAEPLVPAPPTFAPPTFAPPTFAPPVSWPEPPSPLPAAVPDAAVPDAAVPDAAAAVPHAALPRAAAAARDRGPRLGSVAGERTEDDLGMRIAQLPEPG